MPRDLWRELCSFDNLFCAFLKARKKKTKKLYVREFEKNLIENLLIELHPDKTKIIVVAEA